jgi:Tol biopolymer transport system component
MSEQLVETRLNEHWAPLRDEHGPDWLKAEILAFPERYPAPVRRLGPRSAPWSRRAVWVAAAALLALATLVALLLAGKSRNGGDPFAQVFVSGWSPDGNWVDYLVQTRWTDAASGSGAISSNDHVELWVASGDGSTRKRLAVGRLASPRWSPDSNRLAYSVPAPGQQGSADPANWDVVVQAIDGSAAVDLGDGHDGSVWILGWDPTGRKILYNGGTPGSYDLFAVNVDGSGATQLTTSHGSAHLGGAIWSPDGSQIAYPDISAAFGGTWVVSADGRHAVRLGDCCPSGWLPGGRQVAFDAGAFGNGTIQLEIANADGSGNRTPVPGFEGTVDNWSLSPDGTTVAQNTPSGIVLTSFPDPTSRFQLTTVGSDSLDSWSGDGSMLEFTRTVGGLTGTFIVGRDGHLFQQVTTQAIRGATSWRNHGTVGLAYVADRSILFDSPSGQTVTLVPSAVITGVQSSQNAVGADTMVIGPDGPDRNVYRVHASTGSGLLVRNNSSQIWVLVGPLGNFPAPGVTGCPQLATGGCYLKPGAAAFLPAAQLSGLGDSGSLQSGTLSVFQMQLQPNGYAYSPVIDFVP